MIESLNEIFSSENFKIKEKEGIYYLELKYNLNERTKTCIVELKKNEYKQQKNEMEDRIEILEGKYNDLLNKYEELIGDKENKIKEENIKNIIKEVLLNEDIKIKLFEEMGQI